LSLQGKNAQAVEYLTRAAQLERSNPMPPFVLGNVYESLNKPADAVAQYTEAHRRQATFTPALLALGDLQLRQREFARALEYYSQAEAINRKFAPTLMKKALAYHQMGKFAGAITYYKRTIEIQADGDVALNNLAWLTLEQNGNLADAARWSARAVELRADNADYADTLAWIYRAQGKPDLALTTLESAAKLQAPSAQVYFHLGVLRREKGDEPGAILAFSQALKVDPGYAAARAALAQR
jgi:tetratricopeptide (TPR) repeat protein